MPPKELSAFERKRLENIAANRAILSDISSTTPQISKSAPSTPSSTRPKARSARNRKTPSTTRQEPARATRTSSRLAGLPADNDALKRKFEAEAEAEAEAANLKERSKRSRVNGELALNEIAVRGGKWDGALGGLQNLQVRGAQPWVRTWDADDDAADDGEEGVKALRKRMGGLKLYERWEPNEIKITPERVYALGFHPIEDKPIVFAGDKEGGMGVFDASQSKEESDDEDEDDSIPVISVFKAHARTITGFAFSPVDANAVLSSSYDSSIRKIDLGKGVSTQVYAPRVSTDQCISAIEIPEADPNTVFFSTLNGEVGRHDLRTDKASFTAWSLSNQKIGGFSLHPKHAHLIATASLDRTMRIWDLRKMVDLLPSLLGTHNSRLSVSHAAWSPAGHVATTSYDDTVKLFNFGASVASWSPGVALSDDDMTPSVVISHNNQTGRWVSILKPQWQRHPRDGVQRFVVSNMNRFVDVFAGDGSQVAQLEGGTSISAVPAVSQFHPSMEWVAGGTGSGKLCLWM